MSESTHFRIRISSVFPERELTFNIYVMINQHYTLYIRSGEKIDVQKHRSLMNKDQGDQYFVLENERPLYKRFIHDQIVASEIPPLDKAMILRDSSMALMEELFEHPDVNIALENSKPIIKEFVNFIDSEPEGIAHLIGLSGHDFYTYNHSLDVSIYALGLGQAMSYSKKDLEELGQGALFHDIGKRNVPLDILCKKGGLTDAEWSQMKQHPHYGLMILNSNPSISDAIKAACFEHHESYAGNGYPQALVGQEIHPYGRIVAITDTYDAMTTQRSYNTPLRPLDAITMMKEKLSGRYDPEMLKALYSVLFKLKTP